MTEAQKDDTVLDVKNLQTVFFTNSGLFRAVDDVSFSVRRGETLAIVGESGCGKSVTALSMMRLVPDPPGRVIGGSVTLEGTDLLGLGEAEMRKIRGNRISMIFQEPMTSLNPVMRIGDQITEVLRLHREMTSKETWAKPTTRVPSAAGRGPGSFSSITCPAGTNGSRKRRASSPIMAWRRSLPISISAMVPAAPMTWARGCARRAAWPTSR